MSGSPERELLHWEEDADGYGRFVFPAPAAKSGGPYISSVIRRGVRPPLYVVAGPWIPEISCEREGDADQKATDLNVAYWAGRDSLITEFGLDIER